MGPKTIIATGAQTVPKFLIIRIERQSIIYRLQNQYYKASLLTPIFLNVSGKDDWKLTANN